MKKFTFKPYTIGVDTEKSHEAILDMLAVLTGDKMSDKDVKEALKTAYALISKIKSFEAQ